MRARYINALDKDERFDIVHVHNTIDASAAAALCRVPIVLTAHNLNWTLEPTRHRALAAGISRQLDRIALATAGHVVVLNEQTKRALPNRNVSVIPNGVDLRDWPKLDRFTARKQLGVPVDEFRVTYVGRVAPEKGTHTFVQAANKAKLAIPLVADAIGSLSGRYGVSTAVTSYAATVQAESPSILFRGFIHRDEPEFRLRLAAADAVIVPSITEPFGLVVLEALACNAWVIGSDTGGIRDILTDQVGDLVPAGDVDALARAIVACYHRGPRGAGKTAARARAHDFRWDRIASCYIETMHELATERTL